MRDGPVFSPSSTPRSWSNRTVVRMSASAGTLRNRHGSRVRRDANKSGSAEFFEPLTATSPHNRLPPRTTILSTAVPPSLDRQNPLDARQVSVDPRNAVARRSEKRPDPVALSESDLHDDPAAVLERFADRTRQPAVHVEAVDAAVNGHAGLVIAHLGRERGDLPTRHVRRIRHDQVEAHGREWRREDAAAKLDRRGEPPRMGARVV